jgi:hypothetical protein
LETQAKERRNDMINTRITPELREKVEALAIENGRTRTAEFLNLVEQGLILRSMTEGRSKALMLDLFVGARMATDLTGPSAPLAILDAMRKHYAPGDILAALDAFRDRLPK